MKYDNKAIAQELIKTAEGSAYYGNALLVALDFPCIQGSLTHKCAVQRYLNGSYARFSGSHIDLQEAAMLIRDDPNNLDACHRFGDASANDRK